MRLRDGEHDRAFVSFLEKKLNKPMVAVVMLALLILVDGFLWHRHQEAVEEATRSTAATDQPTGEIGSAKDKAKRPKAVFLGDSFTEGAGGSRHGGYVIYAAKAAGLAARPSGEGATGIIADYGGVAGKKKFRERLSTDVFPFAPKVVVIAGGLNDAPLIENGSLTLEQYRAEYDALIADIKTGLPDAEIVVLGPFSLGSPTNYWPSLMAIRDANRAAAQAAGVTFIDAFYFNEENKSSYISADGVHPNDAGHKYLGEKLGADLVEALT